MQGLNQILFMIPMEIDKRSDPFFSDEAVLNPPTAEVKEQRLSIKKLCKKAGPYFSAAITITLEGWAKFISFIQTEVT